MWLDFEPWPIQLHANAWVVFVCGIEKGTDWPKCWWARRISNAAWHLIKLVLRCWYILLRAAAAGVRLRCKQTACAAHYYIARCNQTHQESDWSPWMARYQTRESSRVGLSPINVYIRTELECVMGPNEIDEEFAACIASDQRHNRCSADMDQGV